MPIPKEYQFLLAFLMFPVILLTCFIIKKILDYRHSKDLYKLGKKLDKVLPEFSAKLYPMGAYTFCIACHHCMFRRGSNKFNDHRCYLCKSEKQSGFEVDSSIQIKENKDE